MSEQNKIQLFENQPIRTAWNEEQEEWYFSVVDVIHVLTGSENPRRYWSDLKRKLKSEGATQLYENIVQLKMKSSDGKNYKTDAATTEQLLRVIQSIPSPRAEPVKRWLAEVGRERIEETIDPEQAIDRALETYLKKGYDPDWVHQRLLSIRIRNELTDEWQKRGVEKGREFAILTDEITRTWSGMTTRQYKNLKGLKKENLRDNMSDTELMTLTFPVLSARLRKIISTLPPMRCRRGRTTGAMCGEPTAIFSQSPSLPIKSSSTRTESAITLILLKQTGWDGARQTASA